MEITASDRTWHDRTKKNLQKMTLVFAILSICITHPMYAWAVEAGTYLVTVKPDYSDPETGKIDDPGNNAAIGQGMTERMCGSTGLLEVDASGTMYLTVRYYLSQFIRDVTFEERLGGSYTSRGFQEMQTKAPIDGASDISDKYGYTDYRIPIQSIDSVFRGNAYIEAMGRSVVFFFTVSNPVSGSGDFVNNAQNSGGAGQTQIRENHVAETKAIQETVSEEMSENLPDAGLESSAGKSWQANADHEEAEPGESEIIGANGSGNADDPVTGIPQKASSGNGKSTGTSVDSDGIVGAFGAVNTDETYQLETPYDLTSVPLKEARKLTEPILEEAAGITKMTGDTVQQTSAASLLGNRRESNSNKTVMLVLLSVAAVLLVRFGCASAMQHRNRRRVRDGRKTDSASLLNRNEEAEK